MLTKQLNLMTNLLRDYLSEVPEESWYQLATSISSQLTTIITLIQQDEGPRRRENARHALANRIAALEYRSFLDGELAA